MLSSDSKDPFFDKNIMICESTAPQLVVIGLGMVGISFIEKLISSNTEYRITVFGGEDHLAYNRVGLTTFFDHLSIEKLYMKPLNWYHENKVDFETSSKVVEINPDLKCITSSSGKKVSFDKLVLATGSEAIIPAIHNSNATGVFVYRTVGDLQNMINHSKNLLTASRAIVIGGGLLGLEAAHAVKSLDSFSSVEIVQRSSWLLSRQLDQQAGQMVNEKVEELGILVRLETKLAEIVTDADGNVCGVVFEDGSRYDSQLICFAIGIRARDELALGAGIETHDRGGVLVNHYLETNVPSIYAIGECACFDDSTFGLIAPGIEMASVLAKNLTEKTLTNMVMFKTPDLSTKLKLLGVDVASFGDYFADQNSEAVKSLVYKDPFSGTYKKLIFSEDGKYLLGGMMIGDTSDYIKLLSIVKSGKPLEMPASELILGKPGKENGLDIPDDAQICSCMNVTKADVVKVIKDGTCKTAAQIKTCTKAGTQCGGCATLVQSIFEATMKSMGAQVSKTLCIHFGYSRVELMHIISVQKLKTFEEVAYKVGSHPDSIGCIICKPTVASILATLWNDHVMAKPLLGLQDTNDKYLGNIQRNGTYSVVPRIPGGEITPQKLILIGKVAEKRSANRPFGAQKQDLPDIWEELINGGFESGHAYGKALRTVKSCVGSSWCRFGQGDSVGLAIALEERYKSIRSPHKIKVILFFTQGGVSGCIRECAEAQSKDFGLIATELGYNIYICGNGGTTPKHAQLLIKDCPVEKVVPILDRFLMFYINTADRLQRTARWLEKLPGGMQYLKQVILEDSLGLNDALEQQMQALVGIAFDEWRTVVESPEKRLLFSQFANSANSLATVEIIQERGQSKPANWPRLNQRTIFADQEWSLLIFTPLIHKMQLRAESCALLYGNTQLALFSVNGKYYCTQTMCPHKRAFVLHDGILGDDGRGNINVACPLHKRVYNLASGACSDPNMSIATFEAQERGDGMIWIKLPPKDEIDTVLGTDLWKIKADETENQFILEDIVGRNKTFPVGPCADIEW